MTQTSDLIQGYYHTRKTSRFHRLLNQLDYIAQMAATNFSADYVAMYCKAGQSQNPTPVAYCNNGLDDILNPETIESRWTQAGAPKWDLNRDPVVQLESEIPENRFAQQNQFDYSIEFFAGSESELMGGIILYFRKSPTHLNKLSIGQGKTFANSLVNVMSSIDELNEVDNYSHRLSELINLFEIPISEYRFKDFISEIIKRSGRIIPMAGVCLYRRDDRTGKIQVQEVIATKKPEREFLKKLTETVRVNFESDDQNLEHGNLDLSDQFHDYFGAVIALQLKPDRYYRYILTVWTNKSEGFSVNDRELLSVFGLFASAVIKNAILIRHARKAKRIMERNSALVADMETTAALADMTSGVAHEFNNIIGGVVGRLQLLRMKNKDEKLHAELERIEDMVMEGAMTIKSIQEYSVGAEYKNLNEIDLGQTILEAVKSVDSKWSKLAQEKEIKIISQIDLEDCLIKGNPEDIRTVIDKLLENAVEFSPNKSRVEVALTEENNRLLLTVADNGIGVPSKNKAKIFYPFFSTKNERLSGLGLSVVHGIVTRHQGDITVVDNKPAGTIIRIRFNQVDQEADHTEITTITKSNDRLRILVVDDDQQIREILRDMLSMDGHILTTCSDGYAALEALDKQEFDLMITDLGMPGISGLDLSKQALQSHPNLPIAMITGWGSQLNRSEVMETGIKSIISKPFHLKEIYTMIEEIV